MASPRQRIRDALTGLVDSADDGRWLVAFSGGVDSSVLLHELAAIAPGRVRAVHVCHGMHPDCVRWAEHCAAVCAGLDLVLERRDVQVPSGQGDSPEAAAREARYRALVTALQPGEQLVTAHHADDQAETFLLQALRGSGVAGLAAMPDGPTAGRPARPLLHVTRVDLLARARELGLTWIEDPSNHDDAVDRTYLRQRVWPPLAARWPAAATSLSRAAAGAAEARRLLDELAAVDLAGSARGEALDVEALRQLGADRQRNLLRYWLREIGLSCPDQRHLAQIRQQALHAAASRQPRVAWPGAELRRFGGRLFAFAPLPPVPASWQADWDGDRPLALPVGLGELRAEAPCPAPLRVQLRRGGERLRLPGRAHHASLGELCRQAGVPPWVRERLPLVFADERLVAVADWLVADPAELPDGAVLPPLRWAVRLPGWPPATL
ncbi:tRNA lysidine(34) synthetase TilS [Spectribacter hydrogenoxidans]|uniref:tRNA(Ile)-lysidine synthase n=1 Tax=Spectribacter hydrogenoxidans TaxID=3075608 RepID=A0ABU3C1I7_9GAMM|nr:tRNA lysidine(34) synthetase TilS [Salinisphaera sp. W335]MDT0635375.1 tRNA lysidine(34) synthetase TilS [Salinisphaera sp. W335]